MASKLVEWILILTLSNPRSFGRNYVEAICQFEPLEKLGNNRSSGSEIS